MQILQAEPVKKCGRCKCERRISLFDKKKNKRDYYACCRKCQSKRKFKKPRKVLKSKVYSPEEILNMLSFHLNISIEDLRGDKWDRISSIKRYLVMYCLFNYTELNLKAIAVFLNRTHHTTTINALKKVISFRNTYKQFNRILRSIQKALRSGNTKYFYKKSVQKEDAIFSF